MPRPAPSSGLVEAGARPIAPPSSERGATALEFALLAPVLFLLLFAGLEAGRLLFVSAAFRSAVADAARCAALGDPACRTEAGIAAHAEQRLAALAAPMPVPHEAVEVAPAPCGQRISVRLAYRPLLLPVPAAPPLAAEACVAGPG